MEFVALAVHYWTDICIITTGHGVVLQTTIWPTVLCLNKWIGPKPERTEPVSREDNFNIR